MGKSRDLSDSVCHSFLGNPIQVLHLQLFSLCSRKCIQINISLASHAGVSRELIIISIPIPIPITIEFLFFLIPTPSAIQQSRLIIPRTTSAVSFRFIPFYHLPLAPRSYLLPTPPPSLPPSSRAPRLAPPTQMRFFLLASLLTTRAAALSPLPGRPALSSLSRAHSRCVMQVQGDESPPQPADPGVAEAETTTESAAVDLSKLDFEQRLEYLATQIPTDAPVEEKEDDMFPDGMEGRLLSKGHSLQRLSCWTSQARLRRTSGTANSGRSSLRTSRRSSGQAASKSSKPCSHHRSSLPPDRYECLALANRASGRCSFHISLLSLCLRSLDRIRLYHRTYHLV